jgi:hypothetical protein
MKANFSRMALWGMLAALAVPGWAAKGTPPPPQVVVVGDITKVGKDARVPDAANPVYYVPLTPDQSKKDAAADDGKQPSKEEVMGRLAAALAKRHYLPASPGHPPEQVLSFWWGTADPQLDNFGTDDALEETSFNERAMIALVGSDKKEELMSWHSKDLRSAAREKRHYIVVMAFDYAAAVKKQKKVLWITRMSTASAGVDLTEAIPALVTSGGPAFGRKAHPAWINSGKVKDENVVIAPLEVKETVPDKK